MLETVSNEQAILAIIVYNTFKKDGIEFFTPDSFSQQLGYMNRPKGYIIDPHIHNIVERQVTITQEVLFIKSGKVKVNFFTESQHFLTSKVLSTGDVILLSSGGHGFEILEDAVIIEVKQGPYCGDNDKIKFIPICDNSTNDGKRNFQNGL